MAEHLWKGAESDAEVRKQIEEDDKTINTDDLVKYSLLAGGALILGFGVYKFIGMGNSSTPVNSVSKSIGELNL